jgi:hypothetical protein
MSGTWAYVRPLRALMMKVLGVYDLPGPLKCQNHSKECFDDGGFHYAAISLLTQRSRIYPAAQALGALANLLQCRFENSQFFRARIGKDFPDFGCVFTKNGRD